MTSFLTKIIGDKKEWRAMEERADALPREYRIVYSEMKSYLWRFTAGDGMDIVAILKDVLELFEASAAQGQGVLKVTGKDVAAFCDERLSGRTTYADAGRARLNHDVAKQLAD